MSRTVLIASPTASVAGGVQTWLRELCVGLNARGWRPIVALLRGARAHDSAAYRAAWPELETVEIDGRGLDAVSRVQAILRCMRSIQPQVFLPLTALGAHQAACVAKAAGEPFRYLMSVHGNVPAQIADAHECMPFADYAVCPGRLTCALIEWAGMPKERIEHIPNGAAPPLRIRSPRTGDALRLGYAGRLSQRDKRIGDLQGFCDALDRLNLRYVLKVAGDGPAGPALRDALAGRAEFLGRLSLAELYEGVYPELDVSLLFSESEAFGIAIVEAMLHGVVPLTSRYIGHASEGIVREGETGLLFAIGDVDAAALQLRQLAESPALLDRLSVAAQNSVSGRYLWSSCVDAWASALDRCAESSPRVGSRPPRPSSGQGRLERLSLPPALRYGIQRTRFRLFGLHNEMLGGEEWPWAGRHHDKNTLEAIERLSRELDRATL